MRVFVTGAAGFIGGALRDRLEAAGHDVVGVDKRWGSSTVTDFHRLCRRVAHPRGVIIVHCGAQSSTTSSLADPVGDFVDNALGTVHVAEAARRAGGIPVIFMSTCKVHPGVDGLVAPLGASKLTGEVYLELYRQLYGLPVVVNRPSTVYGPGQVGSAEVGWFTWMIRAAVQGRPVVVHGDGAQSRDVLFIDDMVALLVDQVEHFDVYLDGQGGTVGYEFGGGLANEVSVNELLAVLGHTDVTYGPVLPGELGRVVSNNEMVSAVRGWAPQVGWRDGLARTRAWLEKEGSG